jgi:uncharacterized protein involved in exopolysaccharide biosynthesis
MQNHVTENNIDIKEVLSMIWKCKYLIAIFTLIITSFSLLYVMKQPNMYKSDTTLVLKDGSKSGGGGGVSALAAMAGINLGGGGGMDISGLFQNLLGNYAFHKEVIKKYNITEMLDLKNTEKNFIFAKNKREVYNFLNSHSSSEQDLNLIDKEAIIFNAYESLIKIVSISANQKTGAIVLSATHPDRFLTKKLVDIYLREMSDYIKELDLKDIDDQVKYYEKELEEAKTLDLKSNINQLLSALVKQKVLSLAGEYYKVKQLTKSQVPYIQAKVGPKRSSFVLLSLVASMILGIVFVFLRNFLNTQNENKESELSF